MRNFSSREHSFLMFDNLLPTYQVAFGSHMNLLLPIGCQVVPFKAQLDNLPATLIMWCREEGVLLPEDLVLKPSSRLRATMPASVPSQTGNVSDEIRFDIDDRCMSSIPLLDLYDPIDTCIFQDVVPHAARSKIGMWSLNLFTECLHDLVDKFVNHHSSLPPTTRYHMKKIITKGNHVLGYRKGGDFMILTPRTAPRFFARCLQAQMDTIQILV